MLGRRACQVGADTAYAQWHRLKRSIGECPGGKFLIGLLEPFKSRYRELYLRPCGSARELFNLT